MTYIIAEIGINHNGDIRTAFSLIDAAVSAGCDAVKFQKRTPYLCVPANQKNVLRETPWGTMTYLEYRDKVEFGMDEYDAIDKYCAEKGIDWFASVWDLESLKFINHYDIPIIKIPSAMLTNTELLEESALTGKAVMISTGMSTMDEIDRAVDTLRSKCILMHSTSTYPCPVEELNLLMIPELIDTYGVQVGYSGHEVGLQTSVAAVALGATYLERHITLDRSMWGTDQSASVEPEGLRRLVRDVRVVEKALGDGIKKVYDSELDSREKLRGVSETSASYTDSR